MLFQVSNFFPRSLYEQITDVRVTKADFVVTSAERRARPEDLTYDGKLSLLATDHPARRVTAAGDDPLAMGDRYDYLGRIVRVLSTEFDGVVATVDILEELLIMDQLIIEAGGESFLDDTMLVASINRGGLAGAVWELDDRATSFSSETLSRLRVDGIKLQWRCDLQNADSAKTLDYCWTAMEEADRLSLPIFFEPLPVNKGAHGYEANQSVEELVKLVGVASALCASSANLWLKLPYIENFARVARATTLPILLLGGAPQSETLSVLEMFADGMQAGHNVRGVMAGRNVLFPPNHDDPAAIAHAIDAIVHDGVNAREAHSRMSESRHSEMEWLKKLFGG
jgi:DhnA family fructose-bisphosphate aldolase class Ia